MCTTSSSTTSLPSWLNSGVQNLFQSGMNFLSSPYGPPGSKLNLPYGTPSYLGSNPLQTAAEPGYVVSGLTPMQNTGFAALQSLYNSGTDTSAASNAENLIGEATDAPLSQIDPSQTSSFMNPYISGVLDPTLRNIGQQETQQQQQLNDSAVSMGAFGDARQGVEAGQIYKQADVASGDATNQAYSQAWQTALQEQQANAQLAEQGYGRMISGAQAGYGIYSADQQRQLAQIQALLQGGQAQQQQQQNLLDARSQIAAQAAQSPYDKLAAALGLITGTGSVAPKTTTQDSGLGGLLGTLGSFAGSFGGA